MPTTVDPGTSIRVVIPEGRGASRRLARVLREQLASGKYGPGDQLPTHRALMEQFDVGYSVANRAMEILVREGLVERQKGQGTFVSETPPPVPGENQLDVFALVLGQPRWCFYQSLFQGLNTVASQSNRQTIVCDTDDDIHHQASAILQLIDKRVAGIAIVPATQTESPACHVRLCQQHGVPVVLLHRGIKGASAPLIELPFKEMGYRTGITLRERGHRRVALVFSHGYVATEQYELGVREGLKESGGDPCEVCVYCSGKSPGSISPEHKAFLAEVLDAMFRLPEQERPTAIAAMADDDAEWLCVQLMNRGVRVPEEMSLITVGSAVRQYVLDEQLAAVTVDEMAVGRLAAQLLSEMGRRERPINDGERFTAELGFHAGRTLGLAPTAKTVERDQST